MEYNFDEGDNITITADFIEYLYQLKNENKILKQNNKLLIQQKHQMYVDLDTAYFKIYKAIQLLKLARESGIISVSIILNILEGKNNDKII